MSPTTRQRYRTRLALAPLEGRYAPAILPGPEFQVNQSTFSNQQYASVGVDRDGDFVVAWMSGDAYDHFFEVDARRYAADGTPLGNEFRVNQTIASFQGLPVVGMDATGDFVVTWESDQDSNGLEVYARRYAADGAPLGNEFRVNQTISGYQQNPTVAVGAGGDFVVAWTGSGRATPVTQWACTLAGTRPMAHHWGTSYMSVGARDTICDRQSG